MNISSESVDHFEARNRSNNIDTAPSTPSSSSDYIAGDADDSSDSRAPIPCTLKSVENLLSLSQVYIKCCLFFNLSSMSIYIIKYYFRQ